MLFKNINETIDPHNQKYPFVMKFKSGLANVTIDKGFDERGDYFSIYDIYDFDIPGEKLVGTPYEIYDRVYFDPETKKRISDKETNK